jgi:hypothetical protein
MERFINMEPIDLSKRAEETLHKMAESHFGTPILCNCCINKIAAALRQTREEALEEGYINGLEEARKIARKL